MGSRLIKRSGLTLAAVSALTLGVGTQASAATVWTVGIGVPSAYETPVPSSTSVTAAGTPSTIPTPSGLPGTYTTGSGSNKVTHSYVYTQTTNTNKKTTYANTAAVLSGFLISGSYNTLTHSIDVGSTENYNYQLKTTTDVKTDTVVRRYLEGGTTLKQTYAATPWVAQPTQVSYTDESGTVSASSSRGYSLSPKPAAVTINYDFSLNGVRGLTLAVNSISDDLKNKLTVIAESYSTTTKKWVVDDTWTVAGTGVFASNVANIVPNEKLRLVVTAASGFTSASNFVISAVPLPAALPLFGAALVGFGAYARRRGKTRA